MIDYSYYVGQVIRFDGESIKSIEDAFEAVHQFAPRLCVTDKDIIAEKVMNKLQSH